MSHPLFQQPDRWITTWLSTSQPTSGDAFPFPLEFPTVVEDQTVRQRVRISLGGNKLRLVFSNRYGQQPLVLGEISVAVSEVPHSVNVTFDGHSGNHLHPDNRTNQIIADAMTTEIILGDMNVTESEFQ